MPRGHLKVKGKKEMPTELKEGAKVVRAVKSKSHDARKSGMMIWELDNESIPGCPQIKCRPKGTKRGGKMEQSITLDGLYSIMVKKGAV